MSLIDLTGKAALVTGGSRGIGAAAARMLAEAGAEVATGVFFCVLDSGDIHDTEKLMLLK